MTTYRTPRQRPRRRGPASSAARRAMEIAALALTDAVAALVGDDAIAERERLRQLTDRQDSAQRQLDEGGKPWV
ncbi:hypothetical protein E5C33_07495 [Stenotrophomonas maltophilia]|nr:hypothetical protein E5C33_07495 [Stenotrophomonas maltophilia]